MNLRALHDDLREALRAELPRAVELRHELHRTPEPSGSELATVQRVAGELPCETVPVATTGAVCRVGPESGPCVVLRAELDGLPMREATGAAYASTNGHMHACGHDVHLAALTAVARAAHRVSLPMAMLCLLQPREESAPSGAQSVVQERVLAQAGAQAVVAVHLQPQVPAGSVTADPGVVNAASDELDITVTGLGGHGGYPHLTRDPVPALCHTVLAVEELVRATISPTQPAVISIGALRAGDAANVIAGEAHARGTIRTVTEDDRQRLHQAIRDTVARVAVAFDCEGTTRITPVEPPLDNDPELARGTREWLSRAGFELAPEFRSCGSDDFSFYSQVLPSQMVFLGAGTEAQSLHSPDFLPSDDLVEAAAHALVGCYVAAVERVISPAG